MGPVEKLLTESWELIKDPSKRTTGSFARDFSGLPVDPTDKNACQWCSVGAIYKANNVYIGDVLDITFEDARICLNRAASKFRFLGTAATYSDLDVFNHPPKLYAEAIKLAKEQRI